MLSLSGKGIGRSQTGLSTKQACVCSLSSIADNPPRLDGGAKWSSKSKGPCKKHSSTRRAKRKAALVDANLPRQDYRTHINRTSILFRVQTGPAKRSERREDRAVNMQNDPWRGTAYMRSTPFPHWRADTR
jgi:hypothetical protein